LFGIQNAVIKLFKKKKIKKLQIKEIISIFALYIRKRNNIMKNLINKFEENFFNADADFNISKMRTVKKL